MRRRISWIGMEKKKKQEFKHDASSNGSRYTLLDLFLSFYASCWKTELKKYRYLSNPMNKNRIYVIMSN